MSAVYLMAASCATALGDSLGEIWPRLRAGESAIAPITRFDTSRLEFHSAACVPDLDPAGHPNRTCALMARCLPPGTADVLVRNTPPSSNPATIPWDRAIPQSAIRNPQSPFVIWAGVKGNAEWIEDRQSNGFFAPAHYRRWVCERLGLSGAGLEVNAACASSTAALALGAMMIERGEAESVLVCAADIVSRFTFTGFAALRGLSPALCRPLDRNRDGLCLGDGAAALLLVSERLAGESQCPPLARLAGWGIANDATHITAPARDGCGLAAAIRAALATAGVSPESVGAFCVHGTGTVYNDAMELTALETVFGGRRFPVFSIKGAVGHTLGAAGALEAAVCARALAERCIPATAGLAEPEPRAVGRAAGEPQPFSGDFILTTNSGFGGVNAALLLERVA